MSITPNNITIPISFDQIRFVCQGNVITPSFDINLTIGEQPSNHYLYPYYNQTEDITTFLLEFYETKSFTNGTEVKMVNNNMSQISFSISDIFFEKKNYINLLGNPSDVTDIATEGTTITFTNISSNDVGYTQGSFSADQVYLEPHGYTIGNEFMFSDSVQSGVFGLFNGNVVEDLLDTYTLSPTIRRSVKIIGTFTPGANQSWNGNNTPVQSTLNLILDKPPNDSPLVMQATLHLFQF